MSHRVMVFGPADLDRVLRVDRPLTEFPRTAPVDQSVEAVAMFAGGPTIELIDPSEHGLEIKPPPGWPCPFGQIRLERPIFESLSRSRKLTGRSWADSLGGLGARLAAALSGTLVCVLGSPDDPTSRAIAQGLRDANVEFEAVRVPDMPAGWRLVITSGEHGDTLAVGFRGWNAAIPPDALDGHAVIPCELQVVGGLPNALAARLLQSNGARIRLFAPTMSNMLDRDVPVSAFASRIDLLCCDRNKWEALEDRESVGWKVSILVVTDGQAGSWTRFTSPDGETIQIRQPAFPRACPSRNANHTGEVFTASLARTLLENHWNSSTGVIAHDLMKHAMLRASVAAALVQDNAKLSFPVESLIDAALAKGIVEPIDREHTQE